MGKVVLLGAGPGDEGLLAIKGEKILKKADCIIYDRLLNKNMLLLAPEGCEKIFVGKMNHKHTMPQDSINELLADKASEYNLVVRLKGGDPYVFGRGSEEAIYLRDKGIEVEVIPGISSPIAALSTAGIPITHRGIAKGFCVITAHSKKDERADIDYPSLLDPAITLVFLMGLSHIGEIAEGLIEAGRDPKTPAAVISNGTTGIQKKAMGNLSNIEEIASRTKIISPATIVVGNVVKFANKLSFFEEKPLFGKRILLPIIKGFQYSFDDSCGFNRMNPLEKELSELGADVFTVVTGKIEPVKVNLSFLDKPVDYGSHIIFTSANGVRAFFWNLMNSDRDARALSGYKFAAIGKSTADELKKFGINPDYDESFNSSREFAIFLNNKLDSKAQAYWPTADSSSDGIIENLRKDVHLYKIISYKNNPEAINLSDEMLEKIASCNYTVFTSTFNAQAIIPLIKDSFRGAAVSIGPSCTKAIEKMGQFGCLEAEEASYKGILELILKHSEIK